MTKRCQGCGRTWTRTLAQNARMWALLHRLSERYRPDGQSFAPETWHHYFRDQFLGRVDVRLPDGRVVAVPRSTTELDTHEMADYQTQIEAWCAERGVTLDEAA